MLHIAYFLAKLGADTADNEQHFAEILPIGRAGRAATATGPPDPAGEPRRRGLRRGHRPVGQSFFEKFCKFLAGSFSAVSTPIFASKYSLKSSRRDLHNALLCTVLVGSVWVKKYTKIDIEKMKSGKS